MKCSVTIKIQEPAGRRACLLVEATQQQLIKSKTADSKIKIQQV